MKKSIERIQAAIQKINKITGKQANLKIEVDGSGCFEFWDGKIASLGNIRLIFDAPEDKENINWILRKIEGYE